MEYHWNDTTLEYVGDDEKTYGSVTEDKGVYSIAYLNREGIWKTGTGYVTLALAKDLVEQMLKNPDVVRR
jgi:hypothetical protein